MQNQNQNQNQKPNELNKNLAAVCITVILASIIISGAILFNKSKTGNSGNNNVAQQQPIQAVADINKVTIAGNPFVGDANAKVVVAEWFDYQCPFCKKLDQEAISQIVTDYAKTGKVKVVFKDYQFLGSDSQSAGLAGRAVWEVAPDKFYEWHEAMFEKQDSENSGWGSKADILALVKSLGIDSVKVDQLMATKAQEYQKAIDADKAEGTSFGINGTPGTIIGKQLISGAQPYSAFKAAIDQVLAGK